MRPTGEMVGAPAGFVEFAVGVRASSAVDGTAVAASGLSFGSDVGKVYDRPEACYGVDITAVSGIAVLLPLVQGYICGCFLYSALWQ
jgi:hypothetical protein